MENIGDFTGFVVEGVTCGIVDRPRVLRTVSSADVGIRGCVLAGISFADACLLSGGSRGRCVKSDTWSTVLLKESSSP